MPAAYQRPRTLADLDRLMRYHTDAQFHATVHLVGRLCAWAGSFFDRWEARL